MTGSSGDAPSRPTPSSGHSGKPDAGHWANYTGLEEQGKGAPPPYEVISYPVWDDSFGGYAWHTEYRLTGKGKDMGKGGFKGKPFYEDKGKGKPYFGGGGKGYRPKSGHRTNSKGRGKIAGKHETGQRFGEPHRDHRRPRGGSQEPRPPAPKEPITEISV